eukprot:5527675-Amphidinium_carterae.1
MASATLAQVGSLSTLKLLKSPAVVTNDRDKTTREQPLPYGCLQLWVRVPVFVPLHLTDVEAAKLLESATDKVEPVIAPLRKDKLAPRCALSRRDILDPSLQAPTTAREDPSLAKLRKDVVDARLATWATEREAPNRAKLRTAMLEPRCKKSTTDNAKQDPMLHAPWTD